MKPRRTRSLFGASARKNAGTPIVKVPTSVRWRGRNGNGIALKTVATDDLAPIMHRFSTTAEISVALIVTTGLIQAVRLVGNPLDVFADTHGTLLVVKLVIIGGMLWAAHGNRQRVFNVVRSAGAAARFDVDTLRRAIVIELVIGPVIIGITAAMVVSPPTTDP